MVERPQAEPRTNGLEPGEGRSRCPRERERSNPDDKATTLIGSALATAHARA